MVSIRGDDGRSPQPLVELKPPEASRGVILFSSRATTCVLLPSPYSAGGAGPNASTGETAELAYPLGLLATDSNNLPHTMPLNRSYSYTWLA